MHHLCFVLQCLKPCGRTPTHSWPWSCWKIARWLWSADWRASFSPRTSSISSTSSWTPTKRTWCQSVLNGNAFKIPVQSSFYFRFLCRTQETRPSKISWSWNPHDPESPLKCFCCPGRRGTRRRCWGSSRTRPTWSPCVPTRRRTARKGRSRSSRGKRRRRSGRVFLPRRGGDGWVSLPHSFRTQGTNVGKCFALS